MYIPLWQIISRFAQLLISVTLNEVTIGRMIVWSKLRLLCIFLSDFHLYEQYGTPSIRFEERIGRGSVEEFWPCLQAYGQAHGDVARRNMLGEVQAFRTEYKLIDYGYSWRSIEDTDSVWRTKNLFCGSEEAILGCLVTILGDWLSLSYTMVALSGKTTF